MTPDQPVNGSVSRAEVYRLMDAYEKTVADFMEASRDQHDRMRNALDRNTTEMRDGFSRLEQASHDQEVIHNAVERRVHDLERDTEGSRRRTYWFASAITFVIGPITAWLLRVWMK